MSTGWIICMSLWLVFMLIWVYLGPIKKNWVWAISFAVIAAGCAILALIFIDWAAILRVLQGGG